jgi:tripartite-type tricarboxylate transporter receptor subunit TctC
MSMDISNCRLVCACAASLISIASIWSSGFAAQTYPTKPVRVIIPFAAGGSSDIVARPVTTRLMGYLGSSFVIDNRGGGGGSIGAEMAVRSTPDGYTLLIANASYTTQAAVARVAYDPVADITPVAELGFTPHLIVVNHSVPTKSIKDLIAYMKAQPGRLTYGSSGNGGATHLATEFFLGIAGGLKALHVPYRSMSLGLVDMIGGQVQMMVASIPPTMPHIRSGKLIGLAVTSPERWPQTPDYPTVAETVPGYDVVAWFGIIGPKSIPNAIVELLNANINKALADQELRKDLLAAGVMTTGGAPQALGTRIRAEFARWSKVVREVGIEPER